MTRDDGELIGLIDAGTMFVGFCVRRAQVDLSRRDIGMPKFLPQGFDVNSILMPPRGVQYPEGMAGFLRLLNPITRRNSFVDETIDDTVQVLVRRSCRGRRENQSVIQRVDAIFLKAGN